MKKNGVCFRAHTLRKIFKPDKHSQVRERKNNESSFFQTREGRKVEPRKVEKL